MKEEIAAKQASINDLESEKARWKDKAYVEQQARQRFGFVMPGETSYVVLDENGHRIQPAGELSDPDSVGEDAPQPWWAQVWDSVDLAGDPPAEPTQPAQKLSDAE